jgi:hypothetical protein
MDRQLGGGLHREESKVPLPFVKKKMIETDQNDQKL